MHLLPILALLTPALTAPTPNVPGGELDGYRLAFGDEFDGDRLDDQAWVCRTGPRLWSDNLARNVSVADGRLRIALRREKSGELNYTAGGVISRALFRYGYFEARFRVPRGAGWHTSFWLMRFDGGAAKRAGEPVQEIDICEQDSVNLHRYAPNLHRWLPEPHASRGHRNIDVAPDLSADFHTWGCLWLPQRLTYYFDGQPVHSIDATAYPHGPNNLWLTTVAAALGGTKAVDDTQLPAFAEFDYVRHWVPDQPSPRA
ncbi:MAG: glycoside hydrolase family 16 protein, partial [Armatimonadetes bacterium]|nr:glycoside hydrolase family 16 protein [Armatimonadota bacterium]